MKTKAIYSVAITTALLLIYVLYANLPLPFSIVLLAFLITTASLFWMVYSILTDTTDLSGKIFDEYFYEDSDQKPSK